MYTPHPQISAEFRALKQKYRDVISDITCKMGCGMCVFLEDEVVTMAQWDEVSVEGWRGGGSE